MPRRKLISLGGATAVASAVCVCNACAVGPVRADGAAPPWEYGQPEGPKNWQGTCQLGGAQSPINIPLSQLALCGPSLTVASEGGWGPITFDYPAATDATVLNTGHGTMQVVIPPGTHIARCGGRKYELVQFHFHTPSEHTFDGAHAPMEVHLVHRDVATGGLVVFGVMLVRDVSGSGVANAGLQWALATAPDRPLASHSPTVPVNIAALLPRADPSGRRPYVRYAGSLTTPPCSEQVQWFVFTTPVPISDRQIVDFGYFAGGGRMLGTNARPTMPIADRQVIYEA